jgi:hypothetical protein
MVRAAVIDPERSYSFSDYYKLNVDIEDLLVYFGYSLHRQVLELPRSERGLERAQALITQLNESLPLISLDNESARQQFLIAPVLLDLLHYTHAKLKVGYSLFVSEQLKGVLDYYLLGKNSLVVIEAKDENLQRGFAQLAVELIAMDQWSTLETPVLYGAISIGNVWQFGVLERSEKRIWQDLSLFRVPADVQELLQVLVGMLEGEAFGNNTSGWSA